MVMEERETTSSLVFALNGERFELSAIDTSITLLQFLRSYTRFKGTKLSCGEGGCGACVALLSKYDPVFEQVEHFTVSSCLTLLCSLNNCSITTTDGLGNSKDGFHPIHERFAGFHASQCGFCTPGMCVQLFSALVNAENIDRPEPRPGFSKLTVCEAERAISGNLCRCTGYRPIADACKSFAADVDIEDLGINSFWKKGESKEEKVSRLPVYNPNDHVFKFPEFLKKEIKSRLLLSSERNSWYNPVSIEELQSLIESFDGQSWPRVKLVVGNTGTGYYKELKSYEKYIDLRDVPELSMVRRNQMGIEIGATVTISKAIKVLKEECDIELVFKKIAEHMEKVATQFIRNSGSLGGNLVMAQRKHFPSDIATILLAIDTTVYIMTGPKFEELTLEEFLERPPLDSKSVLLSVMIPFWKTGTEVSSETSTKVLFETYRASPRPLGNALAYLNAAFLANIDRYITSEGIIVKNIQLAFGAFGTKHAIRARTVEAFLCGKVLNFDVIYEAIKLVRATVVPEDGTSHPAYRSSLAVAFLFKFLCLLIDTISEISIGGSEEIADNASIYKQVEVSKDPKLLLSATQVVESSREYYPVGEPIIKSGAAIQASGEAVYVDDMPSPKNCLHGAFIYSTKPLAWIKGVNFKSKSLPDGVNAVISWHDVPNDGENMGVKTVFGTEPLFADDLTSFAGQRIALVVADSQKIADMAAKVSVVDYDIENLNPPILTVEEAVERSSFFEVPPYLYPSQVGDFLKGMAEADHKLSAEIKLDSQYFFYMETQTALAFPDEDNCMVVYSSIQCPEYAHSVIAICLGIPEHNVRVITRRVGGGFGGKAMRAMPVATVCALAAHKLRRPVRMYLDRNTDMIMAGGRHPMKVTYNVGFKSDGKITALHLEILINCGMYIDVSPILPGNMIGSLKKYDWGALSFDIKLCKTNHSPKTTMRAPGEVQASYIAEAIIEHVASKLSLEVDFVRYKNLHTFDSLSLFYEGSAGEPQEYTLPYIWDKLAISSGFERRIGIINQFNKCNKWRKMGISRIPIFHEVTLKPTPGKVSILPDGSVVVEVGGIELGQGLWTKVKQVTAFALGLVQCEGSENLLEKVRVIQADTLSMIQGGITAGSTTSETSCAAVILCCNVLVERLNWVKEKLEQRGTVKWDVLVSTAHLQAVNLSASSFYTPDSTSMQYLNYGAAVSEVEIDLLTGEKTILRADLIYDCGQSMNPAVDLGQIEGSFVQGVGFFMLEEYLTNSDGLVIANGTWDYKIPTIDTIPRQFNVEILNSGHHQKRVLSSKASGEPPLLLAASVHCATRAAVKEAREQLLSWSGSDGPDPNFQLEIPATVPVVKELCGLDIVERHLQSLLSSQH